MDMKRIIRRQLSLAKHADLENDGVSRVVERRSGLNMLRSKGVFVGCLMALPLLVTFFVVYRNPLVGLYLVSDRVHEDGKEELVFGGRSVSEERGQKLGFVFSGAAGGRDLEGEEEKGLGDGFSLNGNVVEDKLLGGLLTTGFDEESCLSRYQSAFYRKTSKHKPSSYLLGRLRKYEALHKQCGPGTEPYNKMVSQLKSGDSSGTTDCQYVVWISNSGLGNRVLTIASAFLYALLTNRVILVDRGADMGDLFCEPFTEKSWLLPLDFPLNQFNSLDRESPKRYGHMLKNNIINYNENHNSNGLLQKFVYLHLSHDYDEHDKLFFCDNEQQILQKIPFLLLRSDNYFVPSLFLIPMFEQELSSMFPEKASVFHHLGRYLFHPSNSVWGLITRFYQAYLANAEERIGIQIRTFDTGTGPFQHVYDQILACTRNEKLLPEISLQESIPSQSTTKRSSKAVLITSLSAGYFEKIRNMFWEHPTVSGDIISVYQPSHEGFQQTENQFHNMKAWAEMYLLSLSDVLITSSWSTFGYVAQSLGGLKPWILFKPENHTAPDPPCRRAMSMEPCFHAPPFYDCKAKTGIDTGNLVPHVKHCEDMSWGLKLVDHELARRRSRRLKEYWALMEEVRFKYRGYYWSYGKGAFIEEEQQQKQELLENGESLNGEDQCGFSGKSKEGRCEPSGQAGEGNEDLRCGFHSEPSEDRSGLQNRSGLQHSEPRKSEFTVPARTMHLKASNLDISNKMQRALNLETRIIIENKLKKMQRALNPKTRIIKELQGQNVFKGLKFCHFTVRKE